MYGENASALVLASMLIEHAFTAVQVYGSSPFLYYFPKIDQGKRELEWFRSIFSSEIANCVVFHQMDLANNGRA
jgi:hypothetical protein